MSNERDAHVTRQPREPFASLSLEHSSTVDRVADELRRAVFDGELESGTPLREVALADSLGVSRPTVREALGLLVAEGLATREPNRGVSVASPDPDSVRDVCRARVVLEIAGVRALADARPRRPRQAVRDALAGFPAAATDGSSYQVLNERHLAFHLSLVGLVGSPRLEAMAMQPVRRAAARAGPGRPGAAERPRPGRVAHRCWSGCSRAATSRRPSPSSSGTSPAPRSRILERLHLED